MKKPAEEFLAKSGLKNTAFRRELLRIFTAAKTPLSAAQIFTQLQKNKKLKALHFDRATLFRNLKILVREDILNSTDFGTGAAFYCLNSAHHHHHHIFCIRCETTASLETCVVEPMVEQANNLGFQVLNHRLELMGLCPTCR